MEERVEERREWEGKGVVGEGGGRRWQGKEVVGGGGEGSRAMVKGGVGRRRVEGGGRKKKEKR